MSPGVIWLFILIAFITVWVWIKTGSKDTPNNLNLNSQPGCHRCFNACGRSGRIRDPTRFLFCCDICREAGYTDCGDHGCGSGKTPADPIGDFIGTMLDPSSWDTESTFCCDEYTKDQLLGLAGREMLNTCHICDRKPNTQCGNITDQDFQNFTKKHPVLYNYVSFVGPDEDSDGIYGCDGWISDGPVPDLQGVGSPNGPNGFVFNPAIGSGVVPNKLTDKYLDTNSRILYGFRPVITFIPGIGDIIPPLWVFSRTSADVDINNRPPDYTGDSSLLDVIGAVAQTYGQFGWVITSINGDNNPYNLSSNTSWVAQNDNPTQLPNEYTDMIIPVPQDALNTPMFLDNIVKGQWVPILLKY